MFEKEIIIDGRGHLMGRLASKVAKEIMRGHMIVKYSVEVYWQSYDLRLLLPE